MKQTLTKTSHSEAVPQQRKKRKFRAGMKWRLIPLFICLFTGFNALEIKASSPYSSSDFRVTYESDKCRYRFEILLYQDDAKLVGVTVKVKKEGGSYSDLLYINAPNKYGPGDYQLQYKLSDGAMYLSDTYRLSSSSTIKLTSSDGRHVFYWYPSFSYQKLNISFCLRGGKWDRNIVGDDNFNTDSYTTTIMMSDPTGGITLNTPQWNRDGTIKFSYSGGSSSYYDQRIQLWKSSGGSSLLITQNYTGSSGDIISNSKYVTTDSDIRSGLSFYLIKDVKPTSKHVVYLFEKKSATVTTPVKTTLNTLSATQADGVINLNWTVNKSNPEESSGNWKVKMKETGASNWTDIATVGIKTLTASYVLPPEETQHGTKSYEFMVHRDDFDVDCTLMDFFQKTTTISVNTNYKTIQNFSVTPNSDGDLELTWDLSANGIWSNNTSDIKYQLKINNVVQTAPLNSAKGITIKGLTKCTLMPVTLEVIKTSDGNTLSSESKNIVIPDKPIGDITGFITSKGYLADKVDIRWEIKNPSNFDYFQLQRIAIGTNDTVTLAQIDQTSSLVYSYVDNTIDVGVYYQYQITGFRVCDKTSQPSTTLNSIGFSQPYGAVSGRVSYTGSQPVRGVDVIVTGDTRKASINRALEFAGNRSGDNYVAIPIKSDLTDFSLQVFVNVTSVTAADKIVANIHAAGFKLTYSDKGFKVNNVLFPGASLIELLKYNQLSITAKKTTGNNYAVRLYVNGYLHGELPGVTLTRSPKSKDTLYLGSVPNPPAGTSFDGLMDEIRVWKKTLEDSEIKGNFDRYITGKEDGLISYYRCDEADLVGKALFDLSAEKSNFNRNDAELGSAVLRVDEESKVATPEQLAIKGQTDANGNYLINTIPYTNEGDVYNITPMLGVHTFNPVSRPILVGPASRVHNGIDFEDVSSFIVTGTVTYEGGDYPVEGCTFEVDDQTVVAPNGQATSSDINGEFSIRVPIGEHKVRIKKTGHHFANDGLILDVQTGGNRNYNTNLSGIKFYDRTRVKLIGRITGGSKENDKVLGFGESLNNIGASDITLTANRQMYNLQSSKKDTVYLHNNGEWKKEGGLPNDSTKVTYDKKDIKIRISPETGEYVAWVYPEIYTIGKIEDSRYSEAFFNGGETLDLTSAPVPNDDMLKTSIRTWQDSVLVKKPGVVSYYEKIEKSDTVYYHAEWKRFYQATPSFSVVQIENNREVNYLGETEYTVEDVLQSIKDTLQLVSENGASVSYLFDKPVFIQGREYTFKFNAYEEYINHDRNETDRKAVEQGRVNITNTIALTQPDALELDSLGNAVYQFMAGATDLTTGSNSVFATVQIGSMSYYWDKGVNPIEVWHLGDKSTGTDFMTAGPNQITAILRDPPGSNSSAYIEEGTTITTNSSLSLGVGINTDLNLTTSLGPKIISFVGLGAGVITETETKLDVSAGLRTEIKLTANLETQETTTFTERFETSDDPLYVGHRGDVFIGNSTNIVYGLTNGVAIQKNYNDAGAGVAFKDTLIQEGAIYSIAPSVSLAYGQSFDTRFAFTLVELEEIMIPKWRDNLSILLKPAGTQISTSAITYPVYVSKLSHNDDNFGKINTDKDAFGGNAVAMDKFHDGPSYKIYFPAGYNMAEFQLDSVMWYNNQINGWVAVLEQNEREKVEMSKLGNYSFGAGASIQYSKTSSASNTISTTFHTMINPSIGLVTGGEVMGIGLELEAKTEIVAETDISGGITKETTVSSGFTLKEAGDDDEITVDYGMTKSGTIAFKTRGGRTSCPYEETYYTKYYKPGEYILSEGTMQIEVPKIDIEGADQALAVPANKTAKFNIAMKNESETGENVWFQLIVDEASNPNGAEVKIDGGIIGNGRMFLVKAGEVLKKVVTVGKGTADIYENIALVLRSECQSDPTDFLPDIVDTVYIKRIEFVPACSDVAIKEPSNNWIVNTNTGDSLEVILEGYDVNFVNFGYAQLEYRSISGTVWNTLMRFYGNEDIYNKAQGNKTLIEKGSQRIKFLWDQRSVPDGQYELRAKSVCVNVDGDYNIISEISEYTTDALAGWKDLSIPQSLGNPSPVNGIFTASDEISITFNENIQTGMLTRNNFSIKGILNGDIIAEPGSGLSFSGTESAYTELPVYTDGSFSIETWFKRDNNTAGTLFSYGSGDNYISLGIDSEGRALLSIGNRTETSTQKISNTTRTWKYIGLSYNRDSKTASVYAWQDSDPVIQLFASTSFANSAPVHGRLYAGSKFDGQDGFEGAISLLHFYDKNRSMAEMSAAKNETKSGSEPNLIGLWELNENEGTVAKDKARARNMVVNSGWYIYPTGKSLEFNGTNQYAALPGDHYPFRIYDDFTIEFWFKGAQQNAATMLSAGALQIGFDGSGSPILSVGEKTQTLSTAKLLNENWHHMALSVKRNGSANAIIDGKLSATFNSSIFEEVAESYYYLGAKYTGYQQGSPTHEGFFKGNIDEVRVWNTALSTGTVVLNKNNKLRGDEAGLKAYYPFELWTKNTDGTYNVLESKKDVVDTGREYSGNAVSSSVAAGLQDARPVKEVTHSFTASDNKVVLNITEELYKIEGVTLEISANDILDMRGNQSRAATWTAYVNRNSLNWGNPTVNLTMQQSQTLTFKAVIANGGGVRSDYVIEDMPQWLSVDEIQGTLQPLSNKELTFTIFQGINIGNYEASVSLTGTNNVRKLLSVRLKVTGERPEWTVNPNDFESSMNVTGTIAIEGKPKEDADDLLAAFIGSECVGVTSPIYVGTNNAYFTFADIYGNAEHNNQPVSFKLWEASTGKIYPKVNVSSGEIRFASYKIVGSIDNPVVFNALNVSEQLISLKKGWTWISTNLTNSNPTIFSQMKTSLADAGMLIKGRNGYVQQPNWVGTLSDISEKSMYVVNTNKVHVLVLEGQASDPAVTPISINPEWNWIGYLPSFNLSVKNALAGINAQVGDQVKGQSGYAVYSGASGWIGSLSYMQPGKGYMYYSKNPVSQELIYPSGSSQMLKAKALYTASAENKWTVDDSRFASSMTLTAIVVENNVESRSNEIEVAAFNGSDCRGTAMLQYEESLDKYIGFLMVYGDGNEDITLKVYDHKSGKETAANNAALHFTADAIHGTPDQPYTVALGSTSGIDVISLSQVSAYPNPVAVDLYISRPWDVIDMLEIVDISGRNIVKESNFSESSVNVSGLEKGMYILRLTHGNDVKSIKFTKE